MGVTTKRICQFSSSRVVCEKEAKYLIGGVNPVCQAHLEPWVREHLLWGYTVKVESA